MAAAALAERTVERLGQTEEQAMRHPIVSASIREHIVRIRVLRGATG